MLKFQLEDTTLTAEPSGQDGRFVVTIHDAFSDKTEKKEMTPRELAAILYLAVAGEEAEDEFGPMLQPMAEEACSWLSRECRMIP